MALLIGLQTGLETGLLTGLGASIHSSGLQAGAFPSTAAEMAIAMDNPACLSSYIWGCQEPSGNLVDSIAAEPLVPSGSPLYSQAANEFTPNRVAVGNVTGGTFTSDDNTVMDSVNTSFAHVIVFKGDGTDTSDVVNKRSIAVAGYVMRIAATTGYFSFFLQGTTGSGYQAPLNFNHADGNWHYIALVGDGTDIRTYSDLGSNTGTIATYGSLSVAAFLKLVPGGGALVTYLASFEGTAAEAIDQAALTALWAQIGPA